VPGASRDELKEQGVADRRIGNITPEMAEAYI